VRTTTEKPAGAGREHTDYPSADRGPFGLYFGWFNVLMAVVSVTLVVGSTVYSFGLFVKPAAAEFGLSRASINLGLVLFHIGSLVYHPVLGALYDRYSVTRLIRLSAVLFALGMVGAGVASAPWIIGLCIAGPIAFGTVGCGALPGIVVAARWFSNHRARAISFVAMGTSLGGLLVFPMVAFLLNYLGMRSALVVSGISIGAVVLVFSFLIRPSPVAPRAPARNTKVAEASSDALSPLAVAKTPAFWKIAVPAGLMMGVDQTLLATITPYMLDRGMALAATASVMAAMTSAAIGGKLLIAWIGDRSDLRILLAITALCGLAMSAVLLLDPAFWAIFATALFTGAAVGCTYPLASSMMSRQFGAASSGTALGLQGPLNSITSSAALYFIGAVHDYTDSYHFAFAVFCGVFVIAIAIIPLIPRHSSPPPGNSVPRETTA
jgi:MFS family permease